MINKSNDIVNNIDDTENTNVHAAVHDAVGANHNIHEDDADIHNEISSESTFRVRFTKGYKLMQKHVNHVPVIFIPSKGIELDHYVIMCHRNSSCGYIIMQFRKNLNMQKETPATGYIFYIQTEEEKTILPKLTERVGDLHDKYHRSDMWLYVKVDKEDIFG
jgi:hypothetical protein